MAILRKFGFLLVLSLAMSSATAVEQVVDANMLVAKTTEKVLTAIDADRETLRADPSKIHLLVNEFILPHFDFHRMSRWVLGKHWRRATEEQQEQFVVQFRTLLVRTYSTALLEYSNESVKVLPQRGSKKKDDVVVRTEIMPSGGFPVPINYSMYRDENTWKVYDITIDGISLVANYRNAFSSRIKQWGIEKLISVLAKRNQGIN